MPIVLSDQRYEEIKQIVADVFVKHKVSCVPVNGFELATKMGVKVVPYSAVPASKRCLFVKQSEDGFCVEKSAGKWHIYYNDEKGYGRINHTIMHEIGHIVLDHSEDSELAEKEVRFFAKYALVPPILVHKFHLCEPLEIAQVFEVSLEAAEYAFEYYQKWLEFSPKDYTDYEIAILKLFEAA